MARKTTGKTKKPAIDLATAQQADGALKPLRSVYEVIGLKNVSYREKTYADYQSRLRRMNLIELHDHAYEVGVGAAANKELMIDRLERKYLRENPSQREVYVNARQAAEREPEELSIQEQAARIMARAR